MRIGMCLLGLLLATEGWSAGRVALVIGNEAYEKGRLENPVNDATDVAAALRALDFEVLVATNLDRAGMLEQVEVFATKIQPGGLALFYFAGHGMELGGENWLLPVNNGGIDTQGKVRIHSVSADDVLRAMEEQGAALNVLVLDACRDNPLPAGARTSGQRGFKPMAVGTSTLVAYSTSPGNTAADGEGERNSPYTRALLQSLKGQKVAIPDLFAQAGASVVAATSGAQVPWTSNTPIWPPIQLAGSASAIPSPLPIGGALGELRIEVSPADAQVYIDGALVGEGSQTLRSLPSNSTREVEARRAGYQAQAIRAYVKAGEATVVRLSLSLQAAVEPKPVATTPAVSPPAGPAVSGVAAASPAGQPYRRALKSGGEGPEMVVIPGGSFLMGSPESEKDRFSDEGPQRSVSIQSFAMGVTELSFADWDRCVAAGGCRHRPEDEGWGRGDRPVINVSWNDAQGYAKWLSEETGRRYRLPTEAEWEYAARARARAGTVTAYWWGNEIDRSRANYGKEECCAGKAEGADRWEYTSPVKSFPANPWGLYDTSGNVWEWVQDCYQDSYQGAPVDGSAVESSRCEERVLRGASWLAEPSGLRSAIRNRNDPTNRDFNVGFRLAEDL